MATSLHWRMYSARTNFTYSPPFIYFRGNLSFILPNWNFYLFLYEKMPFNINGGMSDLVLTVDIWHEAPH